jgi:pseudouridine-5'-phosphate glycosidase
MNPLLDLHPDVAAALADGRPVVALESTIISHGMPWPQNAETAFAVEAEVRAHGAVPATIAVIDGRLKAGLDRAQIERLGRDGQAVMKASRRDLGPLARRRWRRPC